MLSNLKKIIEEMSPLKKCCFWICYLIIICGIFELITSYHLYPSGNVIVAILVVTTFMGLIGIGAIKLFLKAVFLIADKLDAKDEEKRKKEKKELKEEISNLFKEKNKLEITFEELKATIESVILNEMEANEEFCLFAELVNHEIRISIEMRNGKVYPNVIHYTQELYSEFLKDFYIIKS